ncbi:MAG: CAP domain-containing protein [Bradymonadaceae bacterium]
MDILNRGCVLLLAVMTWSCLEPGSLMYMGEPGIDEPDAAHQELDTDAGTPGPFDVAAPYDVRVDAAVLDADHPDGDLDIIASPDSTDTLVLPDGDDDISAQPDVTPDIVAPEPDAEPDADDGPVCGDGVVEAPETCDPPASCPTSCDDGNACTTGTLNGSAQKCDALCTFEPVTSCANDDGCCPEGCSFLNDNDCPLDCRNDSRWPTQWKNFENEVLTLTNQRRAAGATCGTTSYPAAGPLTMDAQARQAARCHSLDMGQNNFFGHTGHDGSSPGQRMNRENYTGSYSGENIGAGYSTPAAVVQGWMDSPGHCTNIMNSNSNEIGVGYVSWPGSQWTRYWTQKFGRR